MNDSDQLKIQFERLKEKSLHKNARIYSDGLWGSWHDLADVEYGPAKQFLFERLEDPRSTWRAVSISLLGYHYKLESKILNKIRHLLVNDVDSGVRLAAAGVLGSQGKFPEKALMYALDHDSNQFVKGSAFNSLLSLAGVPFKVVRKEVEKSDSKEIIPSLDQVKRVLQENNLFDKAMILRKKGG